MSDRQRIAELEANCCRLIDQRDEESDLYEKRIAELEEALRHVRHMLNWDDCAIHTVTWEQEPDPDCGGCIQCEVILPTINNALGGGARG